MLHLDSLLIIINRSYQKKSTLTPQRNFLPSRPGRENFFSDNSRCIMIFEGRGLTSNFLCGGDVDVFWNDPITHFIFN